jgi:hypothetical protein
MIDRFYPFHLRLENAGKSCSIKSGKTVAGRKCGQPPWGRNFRKTGSVQQIRETIYGQQNVGNLPEAENLGKPVQYRKYGKPSVSSRKCG